MDLTERVPSGSDPTTANSPPSAVPHATRVYSAHQYSSRGSTVRQSNDQAYGRNRAIDHPLANMQQSQVHPVPSPHSIPPAQGHNGDFGTPGVAPKGGMQTFFHPSVGQYGQGPASLGHHDHAPANDLYSRPMQHTSVSHHQPDPFNNNYSMNTQKHDHVPRQTFQQEMSVPQQQNRSQETSNTTKQDVATLKRLLSKGTVIDMANPPIKNFADLDRMKRATVLLKAPTVDPAQYADFRDEEEWLAPLAQRLFTAIKCLDEVEHRTTLLNGRDCLSVSILKGKEDMEVLLLVWKLMVRP